MPGGVGGLSNQELPEVVLPVSATVSWLLFPATKNFSSGVVLREVVSHFHWGSLREEWLLETQKSTEHLPWVRRKREESRSPISSKLVVIITSSAQ